MKISSWGGTSPLRGVDFPHSALRGTFPLADEETTLSAKGERDRRSLRGNTAACVVDTQACSCFPLRVLARGCPLHTLLLTFLV